jgi:hypothetical protein
MPQIISVHISGLGSLFISWCALTELKHPSERPSSHHHSDQTADYEKNNCMANVKIDKRSIAEQMKPTHPQKPIFQRSGLHLRPFHSRARGHDLSKD